VLEKSDSELTPWEKVKERKWATVAVIVPTIFLVLLIWGIKADNWPKWTGFGKRETVENQEPGKTLWDWLDLFVVPLSLALLGYILQQQQQQRSELISKEQKEIADNEAKEEVLQNYFDRLSLLLIDKNLLAITAKVYPEGGKEQATPEKKEVLNEQKEVLNEQKELLDVGVYVIRARTLSILRRLQNDAEKKGSVIRFLIEAEVISKAKLDLSGADLSGADLSGAILVRAILSGADLSGAILSGAILIQANLSRANLSEAILSGANLIDADLRGADLFMANLSDIKWDDNTQWPDAAKVAEAENIPVALKQHLGIQDSTESADSPPPPTT